MNKYKALKYVKKLIMDDGESANFTIGHTYPITAETFFETEGVHEQGYTITVEGDDGREHSFGLESEWDDCAYLHFDIILNGVDEYYPGDLVCVSNSIGIVSDGTESLGQMHVYFKDEEVTLAASPEETILIKGGVMRRWKLEPEGVGGI